MHHTTELTFESGPDTEIHDLTSDVEEVVRASGIENGQALVFVPGSTASITTIEFEPGAVEDLRRAVERLAPRGDHYEHDARWGDGNGYSHVRAALLGPSCMFPVVGSTLVRGTWQQIVLCDFDNKTRTRRVVVQVTGE